MFQWLLKKLQGQPHDWQLMSVSYTTPDTAIGQDDLKLLPKNARAQAKMGSTSQTYYCATYQQFKTITTLGLPEDHLESMLDWVDKFGHKYIDRGRKTYTIIKTRDEDIEPSTPHIPIKTSSTPPTPLQ